MVNRLMLMGEIVSSGYTMTSLAKSMGIGRSTLSAKINGHRPFDTKEIQILCDKLKIDDAEKLIEIFLPKMSQ